MQWQARASSEPAAARWKPQISSLSSLLYINHIGITIIIIIIIIIVIVIVIIIIASTSALLSKLYGDNEVTLANAELQTKEYIQPANCDDHMMILMMRSTCRWRGRAHI